MLNKKLLLLSVSFGFLLFLSLGFVSSAPGSIWTTDVTCGDSSQDVNAYGIGDDVFVNGQNFNSGNYSWAITGSPGSCDPNLDVASGNITVDTSGAFCFNAYTVQNDDCGTYKVNVEGKNDNYHIIFESNGESELPVEECEGWACIGEDDHKDFFITGRNDPTNWDKAIWNGDPEQVVASGEYSWTNGGKYNSFKPNKTITYPEGENLLIVYGSNDNGVARDYVRFYVVLNGEPHVEPYCGDGICSSEIREDQNTCPQDCGYPSTNGNDDKDNQGEKDECCCCTSQGYVEYGTPFENEKKVEIISSKNEVNGKPIILNQTFGSEKNREIGIYILIGLLILLALLMIFWLISRN